MSKRSIAIFDFGGVLVDWNPRYLYRKLFNGDEAAMEHFLSTVCTPAWNLKQDEGRRFAEANAELLRDHPEKRALIEAWSLRFDETMKGAIDGTVEILAELRQRKVPLYGLTNWSAETFPIGKRRFEFLSWFDGVVVSGEEKLIKPDPRIYQLLLKRYGIAASDAVFIDDSPKNAAGAAALGIHGIHFTNPQKLREELAAVGLLG
jgi:2-haloacid dehalogenase